MRVAGLLEIFLQYDYDELDVLLNVVDLGDARTENILWRIGFRMYLSVIHQSSRRNQSRGYILGDHLR